MPVVPSGNSGKLSNGEIAENSLEKEAWYFVPNDGSGAFFLLLPLMPRLLPVLSYTIVGFMRSSDQAKTFPGITEMKGPPRGHPHSQQQAFPLALPRTAATPWGGSLAGLEERLTLLLL